MSDSLFLCIISLVHPTQKYLFLVCFLDFLPSEDLIRFLKGLLSFWQSPIPLYVTVKNETDVVWETQREYHDYDCILEWLKKVPSITEAGYELLIGLFTATGQEHSYWYRWSICHSIPSSWVGCTPSTIYHPTQINYPLSGATQLSPGLPYIQCQIKPLLVKIPGLFPLPDHHFFWCRYLNLYYLYWYTAPTPTYSSTWRLFVRGLVCV